MFDLHALLLLIALAFVGMIWFRHDQLRRRALVAARRACSEAGMQLLDETVGLQRIRIRRDEGGWPRLHRIFAFEFSQSGNDRYAGWVEFGGETLLKVELDLSRPWFSSKSQ